MASGHEQAVHYTPRQIAGYAFLLDKRRRKEAAQQLQISTMAARADSRKVSEMTRKLNKD